MTSPAETKAGIAGFTLIEMVVVMAVLGLMLVLVVTRGPAGSQGLTFRRAGDDLAAALRETRSRAIGENRAIAFDLDLAGHRYQIGTGAPRALPPGIDLRLVTVTAERHSASSAAILFEPDGSSTGGKITLIQGTRERSIAIDWLTGRISTSDGR